jgi:hypothetical protein
MRHNAAVHHIGEQGCATWEVEAEFGWDALPDLKDAGLVVERPPFRAILTPKGKARLSELRQLAAAAGEVVNG